MPKITTKKTPAVTKIVEPAKTTYTLELTAEEAGFLETVVGKRGTINNGEYAGISFGIYKALSGAREAAGQQMPIDTGFRAREDRRWAALYHGVRDGSIPGERV